MAQLRSLTDWCHPASKNIPGVRTDSLHLPATARLATGAIIFSLTASVAVVPVCHAGSQQQGGSSGEIKNLELTNTDLPPESQFPTLAFTGPIGQAEAITETEHQQEAIRELAAVQEILRRELAARDRQSAGVAEERNNARALALELEHAMAGIEELMQGILAEKSSLRGQLKDARESVAQLSRQREAERGVEVGLRWQLARLQEEIEQLLSRRQDAQAWLKDWVVGSTEALEQLFVETGVDVDELLERAPTPDLGQGGPLQIAAVDLPGGWPAPAQPKDPIRDDIERLSALQSLARSLPLASPLDHFSLSSGFGKRRDPFTRGWAFHAGLDFRAPAGSKILATAPGRVIQAGPAGPYGKMVEIDHGMGVVTRYGHMKAISVAVGDEVELRQEIGVIGNTGRSTSLHLHYEIRIDEVAYDPARFLDAGRLLVGIFANAGHEPADGG